MLLKDHSNTQDYDSLSTRLDTLQKKILLKILAARENSEKSRILDELGIISRFNKKIHKRPPMPFRMG